MEKAGYVPHADDHEVVHEDMMRSYSLHGTRTVFGFEGLTPTTNVSALPARTTTCFRASQTIALEITNSPLEFTWIPAPGAGCDFHTLSVWVPATTLSKAANPSESVSSAHRNPTNPTGADRSGKPDLESMTRTTTLADPPEAATIWVMAMSSAQVRVNPSLMAAHCKRCMAGDRRLAHRLLHCDVQKGENRHGYPTSESCRAKECQEGSKGVGVTAQVG